jgi:hypothetical protein
MVRTLIAAFVCFLGSSVIADNPTPRELAVRDISEQMQLCLDGGHEVSQKQNPLILVDLDSDGILDAIVNNGALVCSESSWFYYGSAGPHVSIYYSGSDKVDHMMRGSWSIAGDENGIMTFN